MNYAINRYRFCLAPLTCASPLTARRTACLTPAIVTVAAAVGLLTTASAHAQILVSSAASNGGISEYDLNGAFVRTFVAGGSGGLSAPYNMRIGPNGDLYVASAGDGTIKEYNATTGTFIRNVATGLNVPVDLVFGTDGFLYVPGYGSQASPSTSVYKINPVTATVVQTYGGFSRPDSVIFLPDGTLVVGNTFSGTLSSLNTTTSAVATFATGFGFNSGSTFGPDGRLYAIGSSLNQIDVVSATGGTAAAFSTGGSLSTAQYLTYANSSFYVSSYGNSTVQIFDATTGQFQRSFSSPSAAGILIRGGSSAAPEPGTIALLALAGLPAVGMISARRRRAVKAA